MDIDQSRELIQTICKESFKDNTFQDYIERHLAGDFAVEIANYIESLRAQVESLSKPVDGWVSVDVQAPRLHTAVLFYREDAGVFEGKYTSLDNEISEEELSGLNEDELFTLDYWCYVTSGLCRLEGSEIPTHWKPLPSPPINTISQPKGE